MINWRLLIVGMLLLAALESFWISVVMKNFYGSHLSSVLRGGAQFQVVLWPGVLVWLLFCIGLLVFVLPMGQSLSSLLGYGFLFGVVVYGIYDLTNMAFLISWPWQVTVVDTLWGGFLGAAVSGAFWYLRELAFFL